MSLRYLPDRLSLTPSFSIVSIVVWGYLPTTWPTAPLGSFDLSLPPAIVSHLMDKLGYSQHRISFSFSAYTVASSNYEIRHGILLRRLQTRSYLKVDHYQADPIG